ncbi:FAD binding domain-containing protein [Nitriliruptor alkaliphilus]|uniref:FAD binding domain-containing protein n=1 Tax=Nitriliruptor alkaliphilus TaxID=427918 RepID=UPI000695F3FF|nr:xanthine dehydrogenase family protein subunit M [Nitriliruptor alkaliphilus]
MYPVAFEYVRPSSVDEARHWLVELGEDAKLLAGGHSLLPMLKLRLAAPEVLVDICDLPELVRIDVGADGARLGAGTTWRALLRDRSLGAAYPLIHDAVAVIGDRQVRARGTIGGSIAHADVAADIPAPLLALGASVEIAGDTGSRREPLDDVLVGMFETTLGEAELLTAVHIPALSSTTTTAYVKFEQPASRLALCGVAVVIDHHPDQRLHGVRIAVTGAGDRAYRATEAEAVLEGQQPDDQRLDAAADAARHDLSARSDVHADAVYRSHLVRVLTRRALETALARHAAQEAA